jgi:hypothetical protein
MDSGEHLPTCFSYWTLILHGSWSKLWQWNSYYGNVIFIFYSADKTKLISIYMHVVGEDLLKNLQSTALSYCLEIENKYSWNKNNMSLFTFCFEIHCKTILKTNLFYIPTSAPPIKHVYVLFFRHQLNTTLILDTSFFIFKNKISEVFGFQIKDVSEYHANLKELCCNSSLLKKLLTNHIINICTFNYYHT